ncbi:Acetyl-coenzyme A carboxylase carboxyl transferase subunit alpha [Dissostichus eleginoides]|uniref:Acetyl-coenzyme A carboxylase carboxyl transferase subunit alpha n=1 Tax=Dissostichus eleginoides TaxID=100907 RepID=A0AAD9BR61_DISEL|nr:Acetyl-coenzyme A carboxylase carboxyl transferase subunit alpha [Dissostichus eleginoides]
MRQSEHYNSTAKDLPELHRGDRVRIEPLTGQKQWWNKATIIQPVEQRSYEVMTEEGQVLRRNRRHIRMTKELHEDITAGEGAYAELNGEPEPTQDESSSAEAETRPDGMPHTPRTRSEGRRI